MPELSRFYGIIIRMYFEMGAQHHLPHLHAYYQNTVGIYRIDQIEMIEGKGISPEKNSDLSRHGLSYIKTNYWKIGSDCNPANCLSRSRPSSRKKV